MTATIYERDDHALPAPVACFRCGRRSYFARNDVEAFRRRETTEYENRCSGCGYGVAGCPCASVREAA